MQLRTYVVYRIRENIIVIREVPGSGLVESSGYLGIHARISISASLMSQLSTLPWRIPPGSKAGDPVRFPPRGAPALGTLLSL